MMIINSEKFRNFASLHIDDASQLFPKGLKYFLTEGEMSEWLLG